MNSKGVVGVLAVLIIIVGTYLIASSQNQEPAATTQVTQEQASMTEPSPNAAGGTVMEGTGGFEVILASQNDSGQSGSAIITDLDGQAVVTVSLSGGPETPQPAHLHIGSCDELGEVKYPLIDVVDGQSETTLEVSIEDLRNGLPLALNIHKSAAEIGTYVACGDLN